MLSQVISEQVFVAILPTDSRSDMFYASRYSRESEKDLFKLIKKKQWFERYLIFFICLGILLNFIDHWLFTFESMEPYGPFKFLLVKTMYKDQVHLSREKYLLARIVFALKVS